MRARLLSVLAMEVPDYEVRVPAPTHEQFCAYCSVLEPTLLHGISRFSLNFSKSSKKLSSVDW
jgi:hypothetical protein